MIEQPRFEQDPNHEQAKKEYIDALLRSGAIKIAENEQPRTPENPAGKFKLRNGGDSWIYVDHGDVICSPDTFGPFIDSMIESIKTSGINIEEIVFVNVDSKSSPHMTGALARELKRPMIAVTPADTAQKEKGTERTIRIPKNLPEHPVFVILDDVLTSGKTAIEVVADLKKLNPEKFENARFHLQVGLARNPEVAAKNLLRNGIHSTGNTATLEQVLKKIAPTLTAKQKIGLKNEIPDLNI